MQFEKKELINDVGSTAGWEYQMSTEALFFRHIFFIFFLFKQYLFLTFVPKALGLSWELMLHTLTILRTIVRHNRWQSHTLKHTMNKVEGKNIVTTTEYIR